MTSVKSYQSRRLAQLNSVNSETVPSHPLLGATGLRGLSSLTEQCRAVSVRMRKGGKKPMLSPFGFRPFDSVLPLGGEPAEKKACN